MGGQPSIISYLQGNNRKPLAGGGYFLFLHKAIPITKLNYITLVYINLATKLADGSVHHFDGSPAVSASFLLCLNLSKITKQTKSS